MHTTRLILIISLTLALTAGAQTLDGRKIHVKAGDAKSLFVPISLPCDVKEAEGVVKVIEAKTGKVFPATLRDGQLVFIAEGAMPNTEHDYVVKVEPKTAEYAPRVLIDKAAEPDKVEVRIEDVLFTAYHFSNANKKPFLWPILSEGQVEVTRGYPMDPNSLPKDHPHHKSIWSAYGDLNGVDCWAEGADSGFQTSGEVTWGSGDAYGWVRAKNTWDDKDHKPILLEEREYRFYATPEKGRLFDEFITFTADQGDVTFKDTKEGGIMALRMRSELSGKNAYITNAMGDSGEETCWGKPSPWCDYSGELKDAGWRGITVFDNPANLRYPTSWHVRNYGLMGANCFGYSYFMEKEYNKPLLPSANGDYLLKKGEKLSFQYRVYVHSGDVKAAAVADRFADYATPPVAEWAQ